MAIYNEKLYRLQAFQPKKIPTARSLFSKYGAALYRQPSGHPDNTDPYHFNIPGNLSGVVPNVGSVAVGQTLVDRQASIDAQNSAAAEQQREQADGAQASEGEAEG